MVNLKFSYMEIVKKCMSNMSQIKIQKRKGHHATKGENFSKYILFRLIKGKFENKIFVKLKIQNF